MRILVTGGTGMVGRALGRRLARAHQLIVLSREGRAAKNRVPYPAELVAWDGRTELSPKILEGVEAVIHLAGESVAAGRWTEDRKKAMVDSRIRPLEQLKDTIAKSGRQLKILISASAIGIYGDRAEEWLGEDATLGSGFLADLCQNWEKAALEVQARRTVMLRLGVILGPEGGFLGEVTKMFRRLGASRLGHGGQFISWIHIDDVVDVITQSLSNPAFQGPINVVAPQPVTNIEMTDVIRELTGSRRMPPAPAFALKLLYGEMSQVLLSSQRVRPDKLKSLKFPFRHGDFAGAVKDALKV